MFCRAISKPTLRHLTTVRPKTVYRLEEVQRLFERFVDGACLYLNLFRLIAVSSGSYIITRSATK